MDVNMSFAESYLLDICNEGIFQVVCDAIGIQGMILYRLGFCVLHV